MNTLTKIVFTSLILLTGCTSKTPVLGIDNGQLTPCPDKPNCVNSFAKNERHTIAPMVLVASKIAVKNTILNVLKDFENSKVTVVENNYIRAEFRSKIFGFVDDVEFYFPDITLPNATVHVRSAARLGYSDLGVNRERVEQLRLKFKTFNHSNKL